MIKNFTHLFPTITRVLKDFKERKQFAIMKISSSIPLLYRNTHTKRLTEGAENTILPKPFSLTVKWKLKLFLTEDYT